LAFCGGSYEVVFKEGMKFDTARFLELLWQETFKQPLGLLGKASALQFTRKPPLWLGNIIGALFWTVVPRGMPLCALELCNRETVPMSFLGRFHPAPFIRHPS
jgi:hypothetical protein